MAIPIDYIYGICALAPALAILTTSCLEATFHGVEFCGGSPMTVVCRQGTGSHMTPPGNRWMDSPFVVGLPMGRPFSGQLGLITRGLPLHPFVGIVSGDSHQKEKLGAPTRRLHGHFQLH